MKKLKTNLLRATVKVLKSAGENASNAACSSFYYQPKTPKKLQK